MHIKGSRQGLAGCISHFRSTSRAFQGIEWLGVAIGNFLRKGINNHLHHAPQMKKGHLDDRSCYNPRLSKDAETLEGISGMRFIRRLLT